jgi:GntR family transcriptional regulator, transcriptional repressor for pyruvate dehydrogenase complex
MTQDEMVSLLSVATRVACQRMTPRFLGALHASVEQASCLPARPDWERKAAAHAELFTMLGVLSSSHDLARMMSAATGRLQDLVVTVGPVAGGIILSSRRRLLRELRACDADGAAREVERHLGGLQFMGRLACGADFAEISEASKAR